jgi:hypothetical protein
MPNDIFARIGTVALTLAQKLMIECVADKEYGASTARIVFTDIAHEYAVFEEFSPGEIKDCQAGLARLGIIEALSVDSEGGVYAIAEYYMEAGRKDG